MLVYRHINYWNYFMKKEEITPSGVPVFSYQEEKPFELAHARGNAQEIENHVRKYLGDIALVFHELVSDQVHLDLLIINPTAEFPFYRLVTCGMSDKEMSLLPGETKDDPIERYMELMVTLPGEWKMDQEAWKDEKWYWPIRMLKTIALFPHKYQTRIGFGHTLHNEGNTPYGPDTQQADMIILPSMFAAQEFQALDINEDKTIYFNSIWPLHLDELNYKLTEGFDSFIDLIEAYQMTEVIDPERPSMLSLY